jgi:uncharacterized membrane protein
MNEIDYFKNFILCSGDIVTDMNHLYVKRIYLIYLVGFSYIVIEDLLVKNSHIYALYLLIFSKTESNKT